MEIENITRIGLSTWRSSQKKGHLSVSDGLFGKIVIDDKSVHGVVSEVFSNSASGVRSQELKWGSIGGSGSNDDSVFHGIEFFESFDNIGNS